MSEKAALVPLYLQPVLGLMVSGSTVAGEYNDIHYAIGSFPCTVMSEPQLPLVTTCTRFYWPHCTVQQGLLQ